MTQTRNRFFKRSNRCDESTKGFTLVELAMVLTVLGLLFTSSLMPYGQWRTQQMYREAEFQMEQLHHSILGYALSYGKLPCPRSLESSVNSEVVDSVGNCVTYTGGIHASFLSGDFPFDKDGLVVDPWNRPVRYVLSDSNHNEYGDVNLVDWVHSREIKAVGASRLRASIEVCVNHAGNCAQGSSSNSLAVFLLFSAGADDSAAGVQFHNLDSDGTYLDAPFSINAESVFDDILFWASKNELIYWLIRAAQLP